MSTMNVFPAFQRASLESNVKEGWEDEEEQEEEEEEEDDGCRICRAICYLLLVIWIILIGWSIYVIVPTVKLVIQVEELSPETEFIKSDGGCLILDLQHVSSGECVTYHYGGNYDDTTRRCRCEDFYTYSFKDTEGSTLDSSKDVKMTYSDNAFCQSSVMGMIPSNADAECAKTCAAMKQASSYKIGNKVTCWTPRDSQATQSRTIGTEGVQAYTCANAKCVKIFDPAQDLRNLQLSHWNSMENGFAIAFLLIFLICPCILMIPGMCSECVKKVRGCSSDDSSDDEVSRPMRRRRRS